MSYLESIGRAKEAL
jgi:hypothetical protein